MSAFSSKNSRRRARNTLRMPPNGGSAKERKLAGKTVWWAVCVCAAIFAAAALYAFSPRGVDTSRRALDNATPAEAKAQRDILLKQKGAEKNASAPAAIGQVPSGNKNGGNSRVE